MAELPMIGCYFCGNPMKRLFPSSTYNEQFIYVCCSHSSFFSGEKVYHQYDHDLQLLKIWFNTKYKLRCCGIALRFIPVESITIQLGENNLKIDCIPTDLTPENVHLKLATWINFS